MPNKPSPKAHVELVSTERVKDYNNLCIKDMYAGIFSNQDQYTSDQNVYTNSLVGASNTGDKDNNNKPVTPKYLVAPDSRGVPSATLIGNAIIATPEALNFDAFPARLDNYDKTNGSFALTYTNVGDNPGWIDGVVNGYYISYPREGNTLKSSDGVTVTGGSSNGTDTSNVWFSALEKKGTIACGFAECADGITKNVKTRVDSIFSKFSLAINQPFAVRFKIFSSPPELKYSQEGEYSSGGNTGKSLTQNPDSPNIILEWGAGEAVLTIYKNEQVTFRYQGVQIGGSQSLPGSIKDTDRYSQFCIYPLGDTLYVYPGNVTTDNTIKKNFVAFRLPSTGKPLRISSTNIHAVFNCGGANFNFSPIVHPNSGVIISPLFGAGYVADKKILSPSYLGKFGVGARTLPVSFPDANDKQGFFSYLKDNSINCTVDGSGSYTYTLTIQVVNDVNQLGKQLQQMHSNIMSNISTQLGKVQQGQISLSQAQANVSANTATQTQSMLTSLNKNFDAATYINGIKGSYDFLTNYLFNPATYLGDTQYSQGANQYTATTNPTGTSNGRLVQLDTNSPIIDLSQANDYVVNKANQMFGQGGDPGTSIAKNIARTALKMAIRLANKNIYSPAVYSMGIVLVRNLQTVSMNPNPQIDDCDVMSIEVHEAVEGSSATIVLNNRVPCENNGATGKYTYNGSNNFTGIKPVRISVGYQGGSPSNNALSTIFTGYIHKYDYARSSDNQSICQLQCEGREKKLKEQMVVNAPFFDGWCISKDSRVLTTKGLERIDNLYKKGEKFEIVTSYEDNSKITIKDCIAISSGEKEVYKIKLNNGSELKTTLDHKFLKFNVDKPSYATSFYKSEWKKLSELVVGDKIKVNGEIGRDYVFDSSLDCSTDELLGWMVGDGYYNLDLEDYDTRATGLIFGPNDYEALRYLYPKWRSLLKELCDGKSKPYANKDNVVTCSSSHKKVAEFLISKGFKTATARVKSLPEYIWTASVQRQCAFLRGLLSADGTVARGHERFVRVSLASNSEQLILDVQNLLASLGITSNLVNKPFSKYKPSKGRTNPRLDGFSLDICGNSSIRYMKYIGFLLKRKTEKWEPPMVSHYKKKDFQEIISIEKVGIEDVYDICMPEVHAFYANGIYAHNCHLAAFYWLAREAGFGDDEMLLKEGGPTIRSLLQGDPDTLTGGCFEGHVNDNPTGATGVSGGVLHATLPLAILGQESPNYNFTFGTKIWDALHKIREFSQFYMFCNNLGHLIYGPPKTIITDPGVTFVETDTQGNYNEIKNRIDVSSDTAELRNAVFLQGITFLKNRDGTNDVGEWGTHVHVQRANGFPNDVSDPFFAPWLRYAFIRNPKFENPSVARLNAAETFRRCTRVRYVADFSCWTNPNLLPYMIIRISESKKELGIDSIPLVIASHSISLNAEKFIMESTISAERFDPGVSNYDPWAIPNLRD